MASLSRLLAAARRALLDRGARPAADLDAIDSRRRFFRRASAAGVAAIGTGLLLPDDAWAAIEERADAFGITPGTVVDAQGRLVRRRPLGTEPYLGEIMMIGWGYAPRDWALCDGQLLAISNYAALYALLSTKFGGDGRVSFGLPDLRGRVALHPGTGPGLTPRTWGQKTGQEYVTLTEAEMPAHTHLQVPPTLEAALPASNTGGTTDDPSGNILAGTTGRGGDRFASLSDANTSMPVILSGSGGSTETGSAGGNQSHNNMMPFLGIYHAIAMEGVFPPRG